MGRFTRSHRTQRWDYIYFFTFLVPGCTVLDNCRCTAALRHGARSVCGAVRRKWSVNETNETRPVRVSGGGRRESFRDLTTLCDTYDIRMNDQHAWRDQRAPRAHWPRIYNILWWNAACPNLEHLPLVVGRPESLDYIVQPGVVSSRLLQPWFAASPDDDVRSPKQRPMMSYRKASSGRIVRRVVNGKIDSIHRRRRSRCIEMVVFCFAFANRVDYFMSDGCCCCCCYCLHIINS